MYPSAPSSHRRCPPPFGRSCRQGDCRVAGGGDRLRREDRDEVGHALESVGLLDLADRPLNELSGGQQQRAFIARAFASNPELLVLDEPIAGVDAESQRRFRDALVHLVEQHKAGVLLVSHELSAVAGDLDRVVVLEADRAVRRSPCRAHRGGRLPGGAPEDLPLWLEGLR